MLLHSCGNNANKSLGRRKGRHSKVSNTSKEINFGLHRIMDARHRSAFVHSIKLAGLNGLRHQKTIWNTLLQLLNLDRSSPLHLDKDLFTAMEIVGIRILLQRSYLISAPLICQNTDAGNQILGFEIFSASGERISGCPAAGPRSSI